MRCPKCDNSRWAVVDSRHPDGESAVTSAAFLRASAMVSWYTQEYQARKRACKRCGHKALSVEVLLVDLFEMSKLVAEGDSDALRALLSNPQSAGKG